MPLFYLFVIIVFISATFKYPVTDAFNRIV